MNNYIYISTGSETEAAANAEYSVNYYFTSGSLANATDANTTRLYVTGARDTDGFRRQYPTTLQVPNIKNELYVQKTDTSFTPLAEGKTATFSLYAADRVTVDSNGNTVLKSGAQPYQTTQTDYKSISDAEVKLRNVASFPVDGKVLPNGVYYLHEDAAPADYQQRDALTKIIVDDSGVYADAGVDGDDVRVRVGVGTLVHTMARLAANDQIDSTLRDITTTLATCAVDTANAVSCTNTGQTRYLSYDDDSARYLPTVPSNDDNGNITMDSVTFTVDSGWSGVHVTQNYNGGVDATSKQNLGTRDISSLFSGDTLVQVANTKVTAQLAQSSIAVSKTLKGRDWKNSDGFTFTLAGADESTPMPESCANQTMCTVTVKGSDESHQVGFGAITYPVPDSGSQDYTYTVKEQAGSAGGMQYSTAEYQVVVRVSKNADGTWAAAVQSATRVKNDAGAIVSNDVAKNSDGTVTLNFTNTYVAVSALPLSGGGTTRNYTALALMLIGTAVLVSMATRRWIITHDR